MNISHLYSVGNNSRVTPVDFIDSSKILDFHSPHNASSTQELLQTPNLHTATKTKNSVSAHADQSLSEFYYLKTITVLISFLKLSSYDDALLKLGKQLLLLKKATNKQKLYKAALACFKSSIKKHPDNYVSYYFSGLTLCLLGRYAEAITMFASSLRKNTETSTALMHTLSEMLSITEGIRLITGNMDVSMRQGSSPNHRDSIFNQNLDKLERAIINKLQRHKIDGVEGKHMTKEQEQWSRYFELGMYWHGREQGDHKSLMYFRRCLQLNPEHETAHYYVGRILQQQGRYHESLEYYKRAISLRPDEGFYYYMAAQIYTLLEESKEAIKMVDKAIELSPKDLAYQKMKEHIVRAFGIEKDLVDLALEHIV
jgi:tetratricopeptide (TPR) repeat protein